MYIYDIILTHFILIVWFWKGKDRRVILLSLCKAHLVWCGKALNKRSALQPLLFLSSLEVAWLDAPGVFLWDLQTK